MIELLGNHLWQSTLVAVGAGLLTQAFRKHRASVRYWLWLAASVKFLVPFAALVAIGSLFGRPSSSTTVQSSVAAVVDAIGHPFPHAFMGAPGAAAAGAAIPSSAAAATPLVLLGLMAPIVLWFAGFGALTLVWTLRWRRVAAAVRRGPRLDGGRELHALRRLEKTGGIRRPLDVVSSDVPVEPGVFGILRPVLLWPLSIMARLSDEQVESILTHELCHVRRRDNLASAVHAVVQAAFWFHPLVWFVGARLVAERERACDEEVVRLGSNPRVYAETILETCRFSIESPRTCVAGMTGSDLKKRIQHILTNDAKVPLTAGKRVLLCAAGVAAVAGPIAVGVVNAPALRAQAPSAEHAGRRFGPPDVNRLVGFELLPGPRRRPTDDPREAVAWNVAIDRPAGRTSFVGFTGRSLIRYAYALDDAPVVQGPGWIDTESLELSASTSAEANDDEIRAVLRQVFEDRFRLMAHRETRDFPVYALVPARIDRTPGPKLRPSTGACVGQRDPGASRFPALGDRLTRICGAYDALTGVTFENVSMTELAQHLSRSAQMLDREVVDRTAMAGTFDGSLGFGFLPAAAVATRFPATAALLEPLGVRSIFKALPEQLGLRLDDAMAPRDVLVIDRAERAAKP
jgi:uncharacterized protein (TIGR03435 family)